MTGQLVLIPCGGSKRSEPARADRLYIGGHFTAGLRAALAVSPDRDRVRIVSALHGLLPLHKVIAPYDQRMTQPGAITPAAMRVQAAEQGIADAGPVLALLPLAYLNLARDVWPDVVDLYADLPRRGMGYQRRVLATIARTGRLPERINL